MVDFDLMQFTAEVPKVKPIPVPSKPMPVSGQVNKCVHVCVCVRFFVAGLSAEVPPAKRLAAAEAAEERAEWPVAEARFQGMFKILNCSSCSLRHPRWQRLWLSRSRLRSKPYGRAPRWPLQQLSVFVCFAGRALLSRRAPPMLFTLRCKGPA